MATQTNNLPDLHSGDTLLVKVKPNAKEDSLTWDAERQRIHANIAAEPKEGKANEELQKLFRQVTKRRIRIISGHRAKEKRIEIL